MKFTHLGIYVAISVCCTLAVPSTDDISYNYWDMGVVLSDQDSKYLSDDLNLFGDINASKNLYQTSSQDNQFGVHFWVDFTQSRNLSDDAAYKLTLIQTVAGLGLHYSTESFSTYFRIGTGGASAKFKTTSRKSSSPVVIGGGGDIFAPPPLIFDTDRPQSQTTHTNKENGTVGKIGIRYRLLDQYQFGAAVQWSNIDSFGTEFSTYIQRDFENPPFSTNTSFGPFGNQDISLKLEATTDSSKSSVGFSLVVSF